MLAELMRMQSTIAVAGTHGKTTTTSMIACMLDAGGVDPTVINGGIINGYGSNARLGKSDWMVVEADESDGSFLRLDGTIAVVTNIDPEHLDHYGSFDRAKDAFVEFVENVPFYGLAVMNIDHPEVQSVLGRIRDRRVVTYGFSALADLRAENLRSEDGGTRFDAVVRGRDDAKRTIPDIYLPMPGKHNVSNALAAIAVGLELAMDDATIAHGFDKFGGVKRRFSKVGEIGGATIIDDYAHHPVEIRAVLSAARDSIDPSSGQDGIRDGGRVIAVVQPHRFTRLRDLMEDFQNAFNDADIVYVAPVYPAGEQPIEGVDAYALADGLAPPRAPHGQAGRQCRRSGGQSARHRGRGRHRRVHGRGRHHQVGRGAGGGGGQGTGTQKMSGASTRTARPELGRSDVARTSESPELVEGRPSTSSARANVRGKLKPDAPLAPLVWFKSGGAAETLFEPADRDDLVEYPAIARSRRAGHGARARAPT